MNRGTGPSVAVVGVGAVGSVAAAALSSTGRVRLLLCGRCDGRPVAVEQPDGKVVTVGPVATLAELRAAASTVPAPVGEGPVDWLFLAVKAHQSDSSVPWLQALVGPGTTVVVLQNGVEQRATIGRLVPDSTVVPVVVWCPAEPGEERHVRLRGRARLMVADDDAGRRVAALFDGSSMAVELSDDLVTAAWRKLILNAVTGLMAVTGCRSSIFQVPEVTELARRYAAECVAVGRAEGAALAESEVTAVVDSLLARSPDAGSSILTDRMAGRALEWDARNNVVRRLGARHGIPTPISDVVVPLLRGVSAD